MTGTLYAVVGASGAGKDTLLAGALAARADLRLVRRVITRPGDAGGEAFEGVTPAEFEARRLRGDFALWWSAHGLHYGIPTASLAPLADGRAVMFNGSRAALVTARQQYPDLVVINITAPEAVRITRLTARGRESRADIADRLRRATIPLPEGLPVIEVVNDGTVAEGVARLLAALQPVSGQRDSR